jgi:hypothetical protein
VFTGDVFGEDDTAVCSSGRVYSALSSRGSQKHRQRDQRNPLERNYTVNAPVMSVIVFCAPERLPIWSSGPDFFVLQQHSLLDFTHVKLHGESLLAEVVLSRHFTCA